MNHEKIVQLAVLCLQELDAHAGQTLSFQEISQRRGIPLPECTRIMRQLNRAGIVELVEGDRVALRRDIHELTALDILQAVWGRSEAQPMFRPLVGPDAAARQLRAFVYAQSQEARSSING